LHRGAVELTGGRVGTKFRGQPVILLTTTGRNTAKPRTQPLVGLPFGERGGWVVAASHGGHDVHPAWYLNLQTDPHGEVRDGRRTTKVAARDATPTEHAEQWPRFVDMLGVYAQYQEATDRQIPVVVLEPLT
jgi:deazaflavin-dependent oxidoreductase (nitroreductase family)